jgi:hypothetical protein
MAEESSLPTGENRSEPLTTVSDPFPPERVNALMDSMESARFDPPADRARPKPGGEQLPVRDDPVLSLGEGSQSSLPLRKLIATARLTCR